MTDAMRALEVSDHGDPTALEPVEAPVPVPDAGEIRVDVRAAGVNFADVEKRRGNYPDGPTPPYRPGVEVAGVVDAVGGDAARPDHRERPLEPGDRVAALVPSGGYAEYALARAKRAFRVPESLPWAAAAALPVQFLTAHNALFEWGGVESGERVLVTAAAGGVGTAAVQLAAGAGATVVGTASTAEKRALVRNLGAAHAVDYEDDVAGAIAESVGAVDLALDGVGGRAFDDAVAALAPGGRVVSYGMASGRVPTVATPRLLFENRSVLGYHLEEALDRTPERVLSAVPAVQERIAAGDVEVVVDERFDLADAASAHERLEARESVGKLVVTP
jgi:NADPH2:quinone reductase